jgi:NitT/TauT family transport system permease protein
MRHRYIRYPVTMRERIYTIFIGPLIVVALIALFVSFRPAGPTGYDISLQTILVATISTLLRIGVAYALAVVVAVPLALLAERSQHVETLLLPVYDVFESIPNLAVLPVLVVFFLQFNFLDGAAVTILFLNMLWSIVFALVGGLKVIPKDVKAAARIFGLRNFSYVRRLILPAIFPQFVTGSILAVASGWNIIIVAEALHVYAPAGANSKDLFGIGSLLVSTSAQGQSAAYLVVFVAMILVIALFNFFVWQKLLNYSQRFRFE